MVEKYLFGGKKGVLTMRTKLIEALVELWREAESYYLATSDDRFKEVAKTVTDASDLDTVEKTRLAFELNNLGV